ncbi:4,5-DOPA dioxygenase extradiol [Phenylobacterium sp. LjRoot225]|uniref:4,5-DOPA-extradiol-dioxygenase n=1 Tax=Phenylobacterium sp. LjRoot225 TaxID=3342285 RepID=UPI003ED01726
MTADARMPVVFFGHGSPMVAILANDTSRSWYEVARSLPRPKAILSISAHWETRGTAVTAMARPQTIHDFGASFPKALFDKQYPAPGDPALAKRVVELLAPTTRVALDDGQWGLDHGTWSVLVHAYPEADVPVVQLSLDVRLTPQQRFEIGRGLIPLRDEGVLILGTGNVVHNLPAMNWGDAACPPYDWAARFNDEMRRAIVDAEPERAIDFVRMGQDAALAAPSPEHFWPLLYVLGARGPNDQARLFNDRIEHGSLGMTSFVFEAG